MQEFDELRVAYDQQQAEHQAAERPESPPVASQHQEELVAQLTEQVQQMRQDLAGQRAKTMALQQVQHVLVSACKQHLWKLLPFMGWVRPFRIIASIPVDIVGFFLRIFIELFCF